MTAFKRPGSIDDEPFDSFKRRHIEHAKIQTSSASLQLSENRKQGTRADACPFPIVRKRNSRAASIARAEWEAQLKATFVSNHVAEPEPKSHSISATHHQLSLKSSRGIGSPVHQSIDKNFEKHKMFTAKRGDPQVQIPSCNKFQASVSEHNSKYSKKLNRKLLDLNQRQFWHELPQASEKSQTDTKHTQTANSTKNSALGLWSGKKCQNMVPLSTLLITPKEFFNLSILPPVALEREERYNWGHIKRNQLARNISIIRQRIRVLQMSSQAPIPSGQVRKHNAKTQKRTQNPQNLRNITCKAKWNYRLQPTGRISGSNKNGQPSPYVEKSSQRRVALDSQHPHSPTRMQGSRVSQYFDNPLKNDITFLLDKKCGTEAEGHEPAPIIHPKGEGHAQAEFVTKIENRGLTQLGLGIQHEINTPLQATHSPVIVNAPNSLPHVEVEESKEHITNLSVYPQLIDDNREFLEENATFGQTAKPLGCSETQASQHERSSAVDLDRNISNEKRNQTHIGGGSVQNKPIIIKNEGYSLPAQLAMIPLKDEIRINDGVRPVRILHTSFSQPQAETRNRLSPQPSCNPEEGIKNLSDNMKLVSPSSPPSPSQRLNVGVDRKRGQNDASIIPNISVSYNLPMSGNNVLVPDTPSSSSDTKILSFEDSNRQASNTKRSFPIGLKESDSNKEELCEPALGSPDSSNYSEECEDSVRVQLAQLAATPDNTFSNNTSICETSKSWGNDSQRLQEKMNLGPYPSQMQFKQGHTGISRVAKKKRIKSKTVAVKRLVLHDSYRRKGFDFFPSYFSTKPSLFPSR